MEEEIDLFESHGYKPGTELLVPVELIYNLLFLLGRIDFYNPPTKGAIMQYPTEVKKIIDKETEELERVDYTWEDFPNPASFFFSNFDKPNVPLLLTELGFLSYQMQETLLNFHRKNIENGIAVPFKTEE